MLVMRKSAHFAILLGWLLVGCGRSAAQKGANAPNAPPSLNAFPGSGAEGATAQGEPPAAEESAARSGGGRPPSAAPSSADAAPRSKESARSGDALEPDSDYRPGLATTWGETRSSHVGSAPFSRNNPNNPNFIARLFYNDEQGVRAMAGSSRYSDYGDSGYDALGGALTVRLLDEGGNPLPMTSAASRTYVIGAPGDRYVIEIHNNTGNRFEAVATVDGLDVIDGRPGSFQKRGYLVGPWATVSIDGFRRNMDAVAAFRFGSVRDSYAARKGNDRNVGIVGVAFFEEVGARYNYDDREVRRRHDADPFPGDFADPPPPITY
jgi:hypothetical protein